MTASNTQPSITPPEYWTTLSEYEQDEEYVGRVGEEFFPGAKPERFFEAGEDEEKLLSPMKRRTFLKLGGFAALAAMIQGCERPVEKILPYVTKPEEITYGVSNFYASSWGEGPEGWGLVVASREGRPIKLEGNADHPVNGGALDARAQSSLVDLYNPDRLRFPMKVDRGFDGEVGESLRADGHPRMAEVDGVVGEAIRSARGKVVLLTRTVNGPATDRLIEDFRSAGGNVEHVMYDPLQDGLERRANALCFGREVTPRYDFGKAGVVVALGGDPLGQGISPVEYTRGFASRRNPSHPDGMSRVYSFEPIPTLTGMKADYRYVVRPEQVLEVALCLANLLILDAGYPAPNGAELARNREVEALLSAYPPSVVAGRIGVTEAELRRVARALSDSPGGSIVYTGGVSLAGADALSLHVVTNLINHALGNFEQTIDISMSPSRQCLSSLDRVGRLVEDMAAGDVDVLIFHGVNPVYTLPAAMGFAAAMERVPLVVSLNRMMDETTALSDYVVPSVHSLESWGDAEPHEGVLNIQQPLIRVLFGELAKDPTYATRSWQESLMAFAGAAGSDVFMRAPSEGEVARMVEEAGVEDASELDAERLEPRRIGWHAYIRETWEERIYSAGNFAAVDFENFWTGLLHTGFVDLVGGRARSGRFAMPPLDASAVSSVRAPRSAPAGLVLVAYASNVHGDGASMGNPFLLELPDPAGKICWDNYAAISPVLAEELRVKDGDHVVVSTDQGRIEIPVYIQPGVHPSVVAVMLGWGRNAFGGVGDGLGVNVRPLLGGAADGVVAYAGRSVEISRGRGSTPLANVQGHNYLYSPSHMGVMVNKRKGDVPEGAQLNEAGKPVYDRPIIGETTLKEWQSNPFAGYPNSTDPGQNPPSMWEATHRYAGHHWGMTVDLNACIGCNACVVACSIENNVPVVGKDEVIRGRIMHWMRIDRYYRGDKNDPDIVHMPLMCQHCDHAPCETVCPVIATMHNDEGLNVMTYNRCVGTRYCANNCPYKVRRFNFWQYSDFRTGPQDGRRRVSPLELVLNPDVTTRTRGVMEKCTFCIQRIRHAKDSARSQGERLRDGELQTACQQTCPAKAIHFGDRNDGGSQVAADWQDPRSYGLLVDLNTDPSVRYMTMVRNRDEASPFRTKYQSHREDHHDGDHSH